MIEEIPQTLLEAVRFFSDLEKCNEFMSHIKWPNGKIVCPKCDDESVSPIKGRPSLQCNSRECKAQFSYKVGTIFEDSPLGLDKWFVAVWCIANMKNGISSHELGRAIDVTQKTAWFMLHRIRKAMESGSFAKLAGEVESDETFIDGASANMHKSKRERIIKRRGSVGKQPVQGILERGDMTTLTILKRMRRWVARGWCQNRMAKNRWGFCISITAPKCEIARVCLRGAFFRAVNTKDDDERIAEDVELPVWHALKFMGDHCDAMNTAVDWNNADGRTPPQVLERIDLAIERLSTKGTQ